MFKQFLQSFNIHSLQCLLTGSWMPELSFPKLSPSLQPIFFNILCPTLPCVIGLQNNVPHMNKKYQDKEY